MRSDAVLDKGELVTACRSAHLHVQLCAQNRCNTAVLTCGASRGCVHFSAHTMLASFVRREQQLRHLSNSLYPHLTLALSAQCCVADHAQADLLRLHQSRFSSSFEFKKGSLRSDGDTSDISASQGAFQQGSFTQQPAVDSSTSSFGYQDVPTAEKTTLVGQVFSNVASSYDLMNDLMSAGLHRLWKDRLVQDLKPFAGMRHLDVAGGTGDVAFRVLDQITQHEEEQDHNMQTVIPAGSVTVCDINPEMLAEGRRKAQAAGYESQGLDFQVGNAEALPFPDESFDAYTIAFGIRNVTHIDLALKEAHRVLRTGGRFLCLEFSHVTVPGLRELYDAYSFNVIPEIGRVVANDRSSYQYLVESIRKFPDQEHFASMIRNAGFKTVHYDNIQGGIVALHSGFKV